MEPYREITTEIRKHNINLLWHLSDRWFRILEFSFILGVLNYFKDNTSGTIIKIIYWLSWTFMFWLVLEVTEFIAQKFSKSRSLKMRWLIWIISFAIFYTLFVVVTSATVLITEKQFGTE